jgi:hypothetical protein
MKHPPRKNRPFDQPGGDHGTRAAPARSCRALQGVGLFDHARGGVKPLRPPPDLVRRGDQAGLAGQAQDPLARGKDAPARTRVHTLRCLRR